MRPATPTAQRPCPSFQQTTDSLPVSADPESIKPPNGGPLFAVLGAGSWGTALSMQLVRSGTRAALWDWDREHIEAIGRDRSNTRFLPGHGLPEGLLVEPDLETVVRMADEILIVVPSHAFVGILGQKRRKQQRNPRLKKLPLKTTSCTENMALASIQENTS